MEKESADFLFPDSVRKKSELEQQGLVFAQKYLVFKQEPRARELLAYWTVIARRTRIAKAASAQEYAAHNAFRELVEGIHAQIEFAENGLNQPQLRTTNA